jgi:hypothetical protein
MALALSTLSSAAVAAGRLNIGHPDGLWQIGMEDQEKLEHITNKKSSKSSLVKKEKGTR